MFLIVCSLVMAAALFVVAPMIKKMMAVDAHPSDGDPKAELPTATATDVSKKKSSGG